MSVIRCGFKQIKKWNIAKGTTDPKVEFISQVQTQILIKFHLQNLDQASTKHGGGVNPYGEPDCFFDNFL